MHADAQRTGAFAMNHPHIQQAALLALAEVIVQKIADFPRLEGVQIELIRDLDFHRLLGHVVAHFI